MAALTRIGEFLLFTLQVIWTVVLVLTSYVLGRPLGGHALKIGRISPLLLTLHDVRYSGALYQRDYTYTFTATSLSVAFHLPRPSYPRWFTLSSHSLFYVSSTSDISVSTLDVTFWVFPYLARRTAGQWASVELDGFRIRVHKSNATPYWIQKLRQNVVTALLQGKIYRLDDFWTKVQFAGVSESFAPGRSVRRRRKGVHRDAPPPSTNTDTDELRISASARQLHLHNTEGRVYTFGVVDAQLRRDWDQDRGSFVLVVEEARWVKVHWLFQRTPTPWWSQIVTSITQFPLDVAHVLRHPMSTVNIYATRTDITFDEFRIRDASLVVQALTILRAKTANMGINWVDVLFDAVIHTFVRP
ncbi:hypothetical protein IEO21_01657 [Rhodonia placenta]|uniref:Uncharacterized protein n=1 Tax=Rhodonia placenta TaxID=104341 RepID=A0A8H7U522_9APHY|nr:hypothetical protein IEO21_01657 [Postia placenta]